MPDKHGDYAQDLQSPISDGEAIDYSGGDQTLSNVSTRIYIDSTGNLKVRLKDASVDLTFSNLAVGWHEMRVSIIRQTGSTASGLALW